MRSLAKLIMFVLRSALASVTLLLLAGIILVKFTAIDSFIVDSGSMAPAINKGALVIGVETYPSQLKVGDIVTVDIPEGSLMRGDRVTHRVEKVEFSEADGFALTLRGDANEKSDPEPYQVKTVDKVIAHVPYIGDVMLWLKEPRNAAIMIVGVIGFVLLDLSFDGSGPAKKDRKRRRAKNEAKLDSQVHDTTIPHTQEQAPATHAVYREPDSEMTSSARPPAAVMDPVSPMVLGFTDVRSAEEAALEPGVLLEDPFQAVETPPCEPSELDAADAAMEKILETVSNAPQDVTFDVADSDVEYDLDATVERSRIVELVREASARSSALHSETEAERTSTPALEAGFDLPEEVTTSTQDDLQRPALAPAQAHTETPVEPWVRNMNAEAVPRSDEFFTPATPRNAPLPEPRLGTEQAPDVHDASAADHPRALGRRRAEPDPVKIPERIMRRGRHAA